MNPLTSVMPNVILTEIFQHLPLSDLIRYESVSKKMRSNITDQIYSKIAKKLGLDVDEKKCPTPRAVKFYHFLKCHLPDSICELLKDRLSILASGGTSSYSYKFESLTFSCEGSIKIEIIKNSVKLIIACKNLLYGHVAHTEALFKKKALLSLKEADTRSDADTPHFKAVVLFAFFHKDLKKTQEVKKIVTAIILWKNMSMRKDSRN